MINPNKEYMFTLEERKLIAETCFSGRDDISVISSDGWLWQLANSLDASAIVKGYRNDKDFEYEKSMAEFNDAHCHKAKTVLIKAEEDLLDISSTLVRGYIKEGKSLDTLLPVSAIKIIDTLK
jgi:pantetheine-phosphate adenylyltransferase